MSWIGGLLSCGRNRTVWILSGGMRWTCTMRLLIFLRFGLKNLTSRFKVILLKSICTRPGQGRSCSSNFYRIKQRVRYIRTELPGIRSRLKNWKRIRSSWMNGWTRCSPQWTTQSNACWPMTTTWPSRRRYARWRGEKWPNCSMMTVSRS